MEAHTSEGVHVHGDYGAALGTPAGKMCSDGDPLLPPPRPPRKVEQDSLKKREKSDSMMEMNVNTLRDNPNSITSQANC